MSPTSSSATLIPMSTDNKLSHGLAPTDPVDRTLIIGISGDPWSGKSTLAMNLANHFAQLQTVDVHILAQHDFWLDYNTAALVDPVQVPAAKPLRKGWRDIWLPSRISPEFWTIATAISRGEGYEKARKLWHKSDGAKGHYDRVIIIEGPYLWHDDSPIGDGCFDLKLYLQMPSMKCAMFRGTRQTNMSLNYWSKRYYVQNVYWPNHQQAHGKLLGGADLGVEKETRFLDADATTRWAYDRAQQHMNEQKDMRARNL